MVHGEELRENLREDLESALLGIPHSGIFSLDVAQDSKGISSFSFGVSVSVEFDDLVNCAVNSYFVSHYGLDVSEGRRYENGYRCKERLFFSGERAGFSSKSL